MNLPDYKRVRCWFGLCLVVVLLLASSAVTADRQGKGDLRSKGRTATISKSKVTPQETATPVTVTPDTTLPVAASPLQADPAVHWSVLAGAGGSSTIGSLILGSTAGQTFAGLSTIGDWDLHTGFWQDFSQSCCQIRGNVDGAWDGEYAITVADVTYLAASLWAGGPDPPCPEEGNVDSEWDGEFAITVADMTYLVAFLWAGGPDPPPCP